MEMADLDDPHLHLAQHEADLDVLAEIADLISSQSAPQELFGSVFAVLERKLGMVRGTVMLLLPDGRELVVEAAHGAPQAMMGTTRYRAGEGIVGLVAETARPVVIPRVSEEPRFQNRVHNRPVEDFADVSFVCVPIRLEGRVIGTLSVDLSAQPPEALTARGRVLEIVAGMLSYDVYARQREAARHQLLEAENLRLRDALQEQFRPENIVGNSHEMREVYVKIKQVAASDTTVLLRGESGTGKELAASAIHYASPRAKQAFVKVNCAALNENLLESELFGHEKGAFTGALQSRTGRLEEAQGGTLFLDEIGDFSPAIQIKLLRVLQEREYERVGSNRTLKADVRIVTATNQDLETRLSEGGFRKDLYYRINVFPICLPPLRDRKDDILLLADHFVARYAAKMGKAVRRISTPAINMLLAYHWPGNVRELENCIEYAVLLASDDVIRGQNLPPTLQLPEGSSPVRHGRLKVRVELLERDMIADALKNCEGSVTAAAGHLGITPRMLRYKMRNLGVDHRQFARLRES
ncbi:MAG: sigma-54-dependent Fis family transcriptional regulator [Thermoguttaceae bacterium]